MMRAAIAAIGFKPVEDPGRSRVLSMMSFATLTVSQIHLDVGKRIAGPVFEAKMFINGPGSCSFKYIRISLGFSTGNRILCRSPVFKKRFWAVLCVPCAL